MCFYVCFSDHIGYFCSKGKGKDFPPYQIDLTLKVYSPGYVPATFSGIEQEGVSPTGNYNPETMYGISYYIM
jgi:hypothetical protein